MIARSKSGLSLKNGVEDRSQKIELVGPHFSPSLPGASAAERLEFLDGIRLHRADADADARLFHPAAANATRVSESPP